MFHFSIQHFQSVQNTFSDEKIKKKFEKKNSGNLFSSHKYHGKMNQRLISLKYNISTDIGYQKQTIQQYIICVNNLLFVLRFHIRTCV